MSKRVFVTSTKFTGNLGGLSGTDAKCKNKADRVKFGEIWKSWLSDSNTSAATRLNHSENPYVRLDKKIVANSWTELTDGELIIGNYPTQECSNGFYLYCFKQLNNFLL